MAVRIQIRRDTASNWFNANPILLNGELGIETDTNKFKVGNGTAWNSITDYANVPLSYLTTYISGLKGAVNGLASLDASSKVPDAQIATTIARQSALSTHTSATTNVHGIADTSALATKTYADSAAATAVTNIINTAPGTLDTLNELAAALANDPSFASTVTTSIALKAPLASPTFTGTVVLPNNTITELMISNSAVTSSKIAAQTITNSNISLTAAIEQSKISNLVSDLAAKAPLASPTFTGTVSGIDKSMVGLANVDNTSDANKPVSSATQTALNLKATINSPTFTGTVLGITSTMVGLGNVDNTSDANKPISSATQTALDAKSPLNNPTFTGTVTLPVGTSGANLVSIPNSALTNSSITVEGQTASLGGSVSILPSKTGNSGRYLTTNGSTLSWAQIQVEDVNLDLDTNLDFLSAMERIEDLELGIDILGPSQSVVTKEYSAFNPLSLLLGA
jgi:hypothetical protein